MKSWRLRLEEFLSRHLFKRPIARSHDPMVFRRLLALNAKYVFRKPPHYVQRRMQRDGADLLWVAAGPVTSDLLIFYIHGGGFVAGAPETHAHMVADLCARLECEAVLPHYRLAPEHPFPAAYNDVVQAWEALMQNGYDPAKIVIAGDSAGGNLMFGLLAKLSAEGKPAPLCAVALSPMVDYTFPGESWVVNSGLDSVIPAEIREDAEIYLNGTARDDPRVSPIFADFPNTPSVLFHVADHEVLRDDTLVMQQHLLAQGVDVLVRSWPTSQHVWHMSRGKVREADEAMADIAAFVRLQVEAADSR